QKKGGPRAPRPSSAPVSGPSIREVREAPALELSLDDGATRAIPIPAAFARAETAAPTTALESPFFSPDDTNPALRVRSDPKERRDAIVQETFAPFPEVPQPPRDDTNPAFFPGQRPS